MTEFTLHYTFSGGYPPSEASLALDSEGKAEMFLGSSASLPVEELDCAGWFAGALPADIASALQSLLAEPALVEKLAHLQSAPAGKLLLDSLVRRLRLVLDGQEFKLDLPASSSDHWIASLDDLLRRAMSALSRRPLQALRLQVSLRQEGASLLPSFKLTGLGTQATSILFYDPSPPAQVCAASFNLEARIEFPGGAIAWNPQTMLQVPPAHWLNLIEQGLLPAQMRLAEPDISLHLPLPALAQPANPAGLYFGGALTLWLVDAQDRRRKVSLQSARQLLAEMPA